MGERALIIGAGQAGGQAAASLRQAGFDGEIVLIGAETAPPYQRPPLSKAYLQGALAPERLYLRPAAFYDAQNIDLRLGERVIEIDRDAKTIRTENGEGLTYDKLLLATGAPPRRLDANGAELKGVYYLRTLDDADALRAVLNVEGRLVIVGAGYIGLEVAAAARQAGRDVTVIEMADRALSRVAGAPVSDFFARIHRDAGVALRFNARLARLLGDDAIAGVQLSDGETIDCAAAVIGIGAAPAVELAAQAGLAIDDGIVVNDYACTDDKNIWAAGDCVNFPSARYGRRVRLESAPHAIDQAKTAAANMAGGAVRYDPTPWFWSDQYDVKLQSAGLSDGADLHVLRGDPADQSFAVWYFKNETLIAVDAINDPVSFNVGKRLIALNASADPAVLGDPGADLKQILPTRRS